MSNRKIWRFVAVSMVGALALSACGSDSDPLSGGSIVKEGAPCTPAEVESKTDDVPTVEKVAEAVTEVETEDLVKGKGCGVEAGPYLGVDLIGATAADAKVFTDTWADERPITVSLGQGQLIAGLETGLEGMKVGGRRQLTIPAAEAYGAEGNADQGIGADQDLIFVVDLLSVGDTRPFCAAPEALVPAPGTKKPATVDLPLKPPTTLETEDLTEGDGKEAKDGSYLTLNYVGVSCASGKQFDSSFETGTPLNVTLGDGGTIAGFAAGLEGMKVGGMRQILIPAALGYGASPGSPDIAVDDPLLFVIELLEVADSAPTTTTAAPSDEPTTTVAGAEGETTTTVAGAEGETTTTVAGAEGATTTTVAEGAEDETTTTAAGEG